ncbi:hypothetical protein Ocin01_19028 [Orchesella cincta]|uniref:Uncharacterized protein n=1 Tax=Orchesella cincta TaxID=48709 RepID=A0A1D2M3Z1_ORCCI|nr:hypothetical protein Ocin01_19028 [Orchesella cincta]
MPKTKTKPTPVLSRSSSESSLLSIPSPTDESSYDVSKAEEKVKQKINKHAELVRKAAAVSKVAKPSTSKASGSRAKQWGATRGAKQNEAAASKARRIRKIPALMSPLTAIQILSLFLLKMSKNFRKKN